MNGKKRTESGVALLMALSILAMLTVLGVSFATKMRLLEQFNRDYLYNVQTRYITEAGVQYTIAALKADARNNFVFDGINVTQPSGTNTNLLGGEGQFTVSVKDTAGKLYVNKYASANLLKALADVGTSRAQDIETALLTFGGFKTPASVNAVAGANISGSNPETMTVFGYIDENTQDEVGNPQPRAAININTVFGNNGGNTLVQNLIAAINGIGSGTAGNVAAALETYGNSNSYNSWEKFDQQIDSVLSGNQAEVTKDTANPNQYKPGWDSDASGTDFCFHSGGIYDISVTGTLARNGTQIANKTVSTTVKIFDIWNQTTKEQFRGEDANYNGVLDSGEDVNKNQSLDIPVWGRITWFDSCPLDMSQYNSFSFNPDATSVEKINDAIKLGFWDDFEEDPDYSFGNSFSNWVDIEGSGPVVDTLNGEFYIPGAYGFVSIGTITDQSRKWRWEYFSAKMQVKEGDLVTTPDHAQYEEWGWHKEGTVCRIFTRSSTAASRGRNQHDIYICRPDPNNKNNPHNFPQTPHINDYPESPMLRFRTINGRYINKQSLKSSYQKDKMYEIVYTDAGNNSDNISVVFKYPDNTMESFSLIHPHTENKIQPVGMIQFNVCNIHYARLDNVRVIGNILANVNYGPISPAPKSNAYPRPYYRSIFFPYTNEGTIDWGTIFATVSIPSTAKGTNEKIYLYISTDRVGDWKDFNWQFIGMNADNQTQGIGDSISGPINTTSNSIVWRADFDSTDPDLSETPVLEDVWITYMKPVKILSWRES